MTEYLQQVASGFDPSTVERIVATVLTLVGLAGTFLAGKVAWWTGGLAKRGVKGSWRALGRWWSPEPCEVASELLIALTDDSAITGKDGDLLVGDLTFSGAGKTLSRVQDGKTDLLALLPEYDRSRVRSEAFRRYHHVAEMERQAEHEKVATGLRRARLEKGGQCPPHDCRGSKVEKRA